MALLIDYTVTVAVQTAAGTAALTSAVPSLANTVDTVAITVGVILLLLYGNLRGIREAGRSSPSPPTSSSSAWARSSSRAIVKEALGTLHQIPLPPDEPGLRRQVGTPGRAG